MQEERCSSTNTNTQKYKKKNEFTLLIWSINIDTNKKQIKTQHTKQTQKICVHISSDKYKKKYKNNNAKYK